MFISVKKMVLSLFTTKISDSLQLKCLRYQIMKRLFQFRNEIPYKLRQRSQLHIPQAGTVFSAAGSIKFLGAKTRELIPDEMKEVESLWEFKRAIKQWKPISCCPWIICKQFFYRIGFLLYQ